MTKVQPLALSIRQPWAWLIFNAGKDVENRSRRPPTKVIGQRIWLHASAGGSRAYVRGVLQHCALSRSELKIDPLLRFPPVDTLPRGAIVGSAVIAGYVAGGIPGNAWRNDEACGWKLKDPIALARPVPCKGMLGVWTVNPELQAELEAAVT